MNKVAFFKRNTAPSDIEKREIEQFIKNKYQDSYDIKYIPTEIKSGFILEVGEDTYDWSDKSFLEQIEKQIYDISLDRLDYLSLLKETLVNFKPQNLKERGAVLTAGDGVCKVSGLEEVQYGEVLVFESGIKGMVIDIKEEFSSCIIFANDRDIEAGQSCFRTHKNAGILAGDELLGRVLNPLGEPIDGKGAVNVGTYYPIERPAPRIIDRKSVNRPLKTGILSIDSMFPIGRGQRELIIGDRQTGKTAIALDTILHQNDKNTICIYVAIGQKASSVANFVQSLSRFNALDYTIIVTAFASESEALQYIAPYSATAIGEYFMDKGKDVLIIYDDLSKHAVAYRSISLLLGRTPGREAYPGDVFYLHSRLLERSAQLSDQQGGGSMTALPIVETQAGDISAYIPTNIISITDGQIFLESDLFFAGQRPAINVGLSVSRVGGAAQTKAMKKATSTLRLELAQYREIQIFTQFAADLDELTKRQLHHGEILMALLKQKQYRPKSEYAEIITLVLGVNKILENVEINQLQITLDKIIQYIEQHAPEVREEITLHHDLNDQIKEKIIANAKIVLAGK